MSGDLFVDNPDAQLGWRKDAPRLAEPPEPLVAPDLVRVNLACGQRKDEGWIGVDLADVDGVDVVHDLKVYPWPFETDSIDEVVCEHFVEHLYPEEFVDWMNELWRVLKPGARATLEMPYLTSYRAWADPFHRQFMHEAKFVYFNAEWRHNEKLDHSDYTRITANFDFNFGYRITDPRWQGASDEAKADAVKRYWNVVDDLIVHLIKLP